MDWKDLDRLRAPGFNFARRGYDRHEVDRFLGQLVDWLETDAAHDIGQVAVTRKLELVGKSTAHILLTVEQEAEELRRQAKEDIAELRAQADADAQQVRASASDDAHQTREEATLEASQTIEEGLRRRAQLDDEIKELEAQRDATLEQLGRLRVELESMMEGHRPVASSSHDGSGA